MRNPVDLSQAYRLLNHGPVTLVSSAHDGKMNVMAAAWAMPLNFDPPKVTVVIDANTFTRQLVEASGVFALNIPCRAIADKVLQAGSASGKETDKFAYTGLSHFPAELIDVPLIEGCVAWMECRVFPHPDNQQRHDLFIAEVVAAQADDQVFREGRWEFADDDRRTLHYFGGGSFAITGASIEPDHVTLDAEPEGPATILSRMRLTFAFDVSDAAAVLHVSKSRIYEWGTLMDFNAIRAKADMQRLMAVDAATLKWIAEGEEPKGDWTKLILPTGNSVFDLLCAEEIDTAALLAARKYLLSIQDQLRIQENQRAIAAVKALKVSMADFAAKPEGKSG